MSVVTNTVTQCTVLVSVQYVVLICHWPTTSDVPRAVSLTAFSDDVITEIDWAALDIVNMIAKREDVVWLDAVNHVERREVSITSVDVRNVSAAVFKVVAHVVATAVVLGECIVWN